jgi:hypothetical protein
MNWDPGEGVWWYFFRRVVAMDEIITKQLPDFLHAYTKVAARIMVAR